MIETGLKMDLNNVCPKPIKVTFFYEQIGRMKSFECVAS